MRFDVKVIAMLLLLVGCGQALSLSIGKTIYLPSEAVQVESGKIINLNPAIRIIGEKESYDAHYDLNEKKVVKESVYVEIKQIFRVKKADIVARGLDSAGITAFTVGKEPGYTCVFQIDGNKEPICLEH